jgi:hypothetical protein
MLKKPLKGGRILLRISEGPVHHGGEIMAKQLTTSQPGNKKSSEKKGPGQDIATKDTIQITYVLHHPLFHALFLFHPIAYLIFCKCGYFGNSI